MAFNLSKGERFDLSKSSIEDLETSSSGNNSRNPANKQTGYDKTIIFVIAVTVLVLILNVSLWYHVMYSPSSPSSVKSTSVNKAVQ